MFLFLAAARARMARATASVHTYITEYIYARGTGTTSRTTLPGLHCPLWRADEFIHPMDMMLARPRR